MKNDRVSQDALDWAKAHVHQHGDTDIFPVPFEYEVIWQDWPTLRAGLAQTHIARAPLRPHMTLAVPKTRFGFRVAQQLDPLDALLFAAMVYEMGGNIEENRLGSDSVCSYRFNPSDSGAFYDRDNGWTAYARRSRELAVDHDYVLYIDIADFFNQIYHHRVRGALETSGVPAKRSINVEQFLQRFTAKQSRGLPVGPSPSHLLAECSLNDVDSFLEQNGTRFVRYIDDFRIFSDSTAELTRLLEEITSILNANYGLALQGGKTQLDESGEFIRSHMSDAGHQFGQRLDLRLETLVSDLSDLSEELGYGEVSLEDIPDAEVAGEAAELLHDSFEEALKTGPTRLGALSFLLREARAWSYADLCPPLLDHVKLLFPIIREVCRYAKQFIPTGDRAAGTRLLEAHRASDYVSSPYVALWLLDLFVDRPDVMAFDEAMELAKEHEYRLGLRPQALLAKVHSKDYWVRRRKDEVANLKPWDRRALIWAATVLPESERTAWLAMVEKLSSDPLDAAIARMAREG